MAREFSVVVGINATKAIAGGRQFKAGADQVNRSNRTMQRSTARTTKRMTAMITTMGRFRGVASVMFAGFLGVGGIGAVIRTISQFETKISQVTALIAAQNPRSLGGAMSALTEKARELGATTLFTAGQAAEGMRFLSLAGFDALEVYQAIEPALILATVGMLDLGNAADIVSNIMAAFSINAEDTEDVVNALAFTASRTNTSIQQLGEAMKFVGPVAGALGIDVKETSVALGILGNSGLQASLAGTSLRRVMSGLLNPSKEARKVFASMGVTQKELVDTLTGPQGLVNLVSLLAEKGIDAADAFLLFGQRGAPGLLSLVNQKDKLRELTDGVEDLGNIAREQAKIIADNLGGDARIAISALSEVIIGLGRTGFGDWLRGVTQSTTGFFRALSGIPTPAEEMTDAMQKGAKFAGFLTDNMDNLRVAAHVLAAILLKNLVVGLIRTVAAMGASATAAYADATAKGVATLATNAFTFSVNILKGALVATGVGALLVGAGLLLQWALSSDDATASAEDLTEAMEEQRIEAEKLIFVFDLLDTADRALASAAAIKELEIQQARMASLREEMEQFSAASEGIAIQQERVTAAQAALNAEIEGTEAFDVAKTNLDIQTTAFVALGEAIGQAGYLELKQEIAELDPSILMLIEDIEAMRLVTEGLAVNMEAARDMIRGVGQSIEDTQPSFEELTGLLQEESVAFRELVDEADPAGVAIAKVEEKMTLFNKVSGLTTDQLEKLKITEEELARVQAQLDAEMTKAEKTLNDVEKAAKGAGKELLKMSQKNAIILAGTNKVKIAQIKHTAALREHVLAMISLKVPADVMVQVIEAMNAAHEENIETLKNACDETDKLTGCMDENAKAMDALWDQAMRNIQDSFADAFRNIGSGFDDFADSILDAFKDLLANMAAQAAINNIFGGGGGFFNDFFGGISGGFGGGGGGGAASGGGVGSQAGNQIGDKIGSAIVGSEAFAALAGAAVAFGQGAGAFLGIGQSAGLVSGTGAFGVGGSTSAISSVGGSGASVAGGAAAGAGLGAIAGLVVDAILGGRGDPLRGAIFATIGGIIGSIWGPIGSLAGGAIGAFVDNLIGGAQKLEASSLTLVSTAGQLTGEVERVVSTQRSLFRGRKMKTTTDNVTEEFNALEDLFLNFVGSLVNAASILGGDAAGFIDDFSFSREINIKKKSADQISQLVTDFMNDMMGSAIDEFLRDVTGLEDHMVLVLATFASGLAEGSTAAFDAASEELAQWVADHPALDNLFDGQISNALASGTFATQISGASADEVETFVRALSALVSITSLLDADLVTLTADAIEEANKTAFQSYGDALGAYREVIAEYDGSLESLERLAEATSVITNLQAGLIAIYQQVGAEISNLFQGSAQSIRESLLSEEELFNLRKNQIDELVEQASLTTDPQELDRLAKEINRLGLDAFNLLDDDQKALLGPEFIEFFEGLDEQFAGQIAEGIGDIVQDQADLDIEVANRMEEAAQAIIDASTATVEFYEAWAGTIDQRYELGG